MQDIIGTLRDNLINTPRIIGRENFINTAVLIPLVFINNELHLLFQLRNKNIRQGGEVCFPGGKFDFNYDHDFKDTALRETYEEIGISIDKIKVIGRLGTLIARGGLTVEAYVGILKISSLNELNINYDEVEKIFTIPLEFFISTEPESYSVRLEVQPYYFENGVKVELLPSKELGLPGIYYEPWSGNKQKVYVYKTDEGVIWGITGELIYELSNMFK